MHRKYAYVGSKVEAATSGSRADLCADLAQVAVGKMRGWCRQTAEGGVEILLVFETSAAPARPVRCLHCRSAVVTSHPTVLLFSPQRTERVVLVCPSWHNYIISHGRPILGKIMSSQTILPNNTTSYHTVTVSI